MTTACAALCATALALAPTAQGKVRKSLGVDVSRFQRTINWSQVAGAGVRFAFVQASRGSGADCTVKPDDCGADAYFASNRANASSVGIRVGAYHRAFAAGSTVAAARADALAEAEVFLAQVGSLQSGNLLPALDVETPFTGLDSTRLTLWVRVWLKRVKAQLGVKPIIYTNNSSWGATGHTREFARARYPLWVAQWSVPRPTLIPAGNWAGRGWAVWQFTSSGSVPGISARVDMDRLRVRLAKLTIP